MYLTDNTKNIQTIYLNDLIEHIVLLGLFGTIMIPSINIGIRVSLITPCSLLLIAILPYLIYKNYIVINRFIVWYFFILLAIFYSINNSYLQLDVDSTFRDYMELFRYIQVLPYLLIISVIHYSSFEKKFNIYAKISIVYLIFIAFLEITNIANLGYYIGLIYSGAHHTESMLFASKRIVVTGSDPNVGAIIVAFFLIYTILNQTQNILYKNIKIILLFIILLMTQSRSVFVGIILSIFIYILFFSKLNILYKLLMISLVGFLVYQIINILNLEYILIGFQTALEGTNESLNVRFENMFLGYERLIESPYLGWGPAKAIHDTNIDSEYVLIMQRYGSIGISLFLGYILLILHFSYNAILNKHVKNVLFPRMMFLIMIIGTVTMITNNFFSGYQTSSIVTLIIVSCVSYMNEIKKSMRNKYV